MIEPQAQRYIQSRHYRTVINFDSNSQFCFDNDVAAEGIMPASRARCGAPPLAQEECQAN